MQLSGGTKLTTLIGGKGNDTVNLNNATQNLIKYFSDDGNDTIVGFNATSTLQIGNGTGTYSKSIATAGGNVLVSVCRGVVTLAGAANLSIINIKGKETSDEPKWTLNKTTATYGSLVEKLITVNDGYTFALGSDVAKPTSTAATFANGKYATAGFYVDTKNKTIAIGASADNGKDVKLLSAPAGYKLTLGSSLSKPETKSASWTLNGSRLGCFDKRR